MYTGGGWLRTNLVLTRDTAQGMLVAPQLYRLHGIRFHLLHFIHLPQTSVRSVKLNSLPVK